MQSQHCNRPMTPATGSGATVTKQNLFVSLSEVAYACCLLAPCARPARRVALTGAHVAPTNGEEAAADVRLKNTI